MSRSPWQLGVLCVFFHGADINDLFKRDVCNRAANPGVCLCRVVDVEDCFGVLLGNRVEADDAAVERLVELEVLLLRVLHVHSVDRVVVRLQKCVSLCLLSGVLSLWLTSA